MRRTLLITGAAVLISGGAVAGLVLTRDSGGKDAAVNPGLPPATADVTRTTLVDTKTVSGTLGYGAPAPISASGTGTLTWIAPVGSTVKRGEPLFKVDERPVADLYGSLPMYRTLRAGTNGRDVRQLERNLAALGYGGSTVDGAYTASTVVAVRAWQAKLGLPETGTVEPGQVVFTRGPIRIAGHMARVGDTLGRESAEGGASVLSYTGTSRRVTVELEVADSALAVRGRTVTVKVPGRPAVRGRIARVGTVATAQRTTGDGGAASDEGGAPDASGSAASDASIEVTVTIADQKALGSLDRAPVDVDLVSSKREEVLVVPVAALLALAKGGFGVQVVAGDRTRTVPVKTGMFAAGQVEVSGEGIAEGLSVGVPK
jgi:peptidoglycan hydrolase-like protein with peptidoglycan-binding domain